MQAKVGNGRENRCGNGIRRRHVTQGAETSGGRWWVAGVGDVQVNGATRRKRRWGEGVTDRCGDDKRLLMGGH